MRGFTLNDLNPFIDLDWAEVLTWLYANDVKVDESSVCQAYFRRWASWQILCKTPRKGSWSGCNATRTSD